MTVFPL